MRKIFYTIFAVLAVSILIGGSIGQVIHYFDGMTVEAGLANPHAVYAPHIKSRVVWFCLDGIKWYEFNARSVNRYQLSIVRDTVGNVVRCE